MPTVIGKKELSERVIEFRREKGLSQLALADLVGCSKRTIFSIETGEISPDSKWLQPVENVIAGKKAWLVVPPGTEKEKAAFIAGALGVEPDPEPMVIPEPKLEPEKGIEISSNVPLPVEREQELPELLAAWLRVCHNDKPGAPVVIHNVVQENNPRMNSYYGGLDMETATNLRLDDYQREVLRSRVAENYVTDYGHGDAPPPLVLGMRGTRLKFDKATGTLTLYDPVYIIDGLQRVYGALKATLEGIKPFLTARIYIGTSLKFELEEFTKLNTKGQKVSSNKMIWNLRHENRFVQMFINLCDDPAFVLRHRVQWDHYQKREEVITAYSMLRVLSRLFIRFQPGMIHSNYKILSERLNQVMAKIGEQCMRESILHYWDCVDEALDIKNITLHEGNVQVHPAFNSALARVFSEHTQFWDGADLNVSTNFRRRLSRFPIHDPQIRALLSSSIDGKSNEMVRIMLISTFNEGKADKYHLRRFSA